MKVGIDSKSAKKGSKEVVDSLDKISKQAKDTGKDFVAAAQGSTSAMVDLAKGALTSRAALVALPFAAATALAIGLAKAAFNVAENLDKIGKAADKAGVSVDFFQRVSFVAGQAGIEISTINGLFKDLNIKAGQANSGNKELIASFKMLGVATKDVNGNARKTEEIFKDVQRALSKIPDITTRNAIGIKLMGEQMTQAGNIFNKSGSEFDKALSGARGVASEKAIRDSEKLNDAWDNLAKTVGGDYNEAMAKLIPLLTAGVENTLELYESISKLTSGVIKSRDEFDKLAADTLVKSAKAMADNAKGWFDWATNDKFDYAITRRTAAMNKLKDAIKEAIPASTGPFGTTPEAGHKAKIGSSESDISKAAKAKMLDEEEKANRKLQDRWEAHLKAVRDATNAHGEMNFRLAAKWKQVLLDNEIKQEMSAGKRSAEWKKAALDKQWEMEVSAANRVIAWKKALVDKEKENWTKLLEVSTQGLSNISNAITTWNGVDLAKTRDNASKQSETIQSRHDKELSFLNDARSKNEIDDQQYNDKKFALEQKTHNALVQLDKATTDKLNKEGRRAFELNKQIETANAIIQGIGATIAAYKAGATFGPVVAAAFAATAAAATGAMIRSIQSQSFNSTSGVAVGSAPTPNVPATSAGKQDSGKGGTTQIYVNFAGITNEDFVKNTVLPGLRDLVNNNEEVIFNANSRQATILPGRG